jgi:hypothetical protein
LIFKLFAGFAEGGKRCQMVVVPPSGNIGEIYPRLVSRQKIRAPIGTMLPSPERRTQEAAPVATSFQFGSRDEASRLKVQ